MTTRTVNNVTLVKAGPIETSEAGAESLWLAFSNRFEVRADANCERPSELEWGVWDRQAGRDGDWADGGRGNGVSPNTLDAATKLINDVIAAEIADNRARAAKDPEVWPVGSWVVLDSVNDIFAAPRKVTVIGYSSDGMAMYAEGHITVMVTDAHNLTV